MPNEEDQEAPRSEPDVAPERRLTMSDWARYFPYELRPEGFCPELMPPAIKIPGTPGYFACEVYLEGWVSLRALGIEREDGLIMDHINECWWCHGIIYGDGVEFETSIDEEIERRRTQRRMRVRRRFMKIAAAAVVVVAAGWWGAIELKSVSNDPTDARIEAAESNLWSLFEKTLKRQGQPGIQALLAGADEATTNEFIAWACTHGVTVVYGDVVSLLTDARPRVRSMALRRLMTVPAASLSTHKPQLQAIAQTPGYDPELAPILAQLITTIP